MEPWVLASSSNRCCTDPPTTWSANTIRSSTGMAVLSAQSALSSSLRPVSVSHRTQLMRGRILRSDVISELVSKIARFDLFTRIRVCEPTYGRRGPLVINLFEASSTMTRIDLSGIAVGESYLTRTACSCAAGIVIPVRGVPHCSQVLCDDDRARRTGAPEDLLQ